MKKSPDPNASEFNTPAEMLARAAYLASLASGTAGFLLVLAGAVAGDPRLVAGGALALAAAWLTRDGLQRRGQLADAAQALDTFGSDDPLTEDPHVAEFVALLHRRDALEQQRGSPDFDPWAVQTVRHDIQKMVEKDPALDRLTRT